MAELTPTMMLMVSEIEKERESLVSMILQEAREPDISPIFWGNSFADAFAQLEAWQAGFKKARQPGGTFWDILQIRPTNNIDVIKKAYRSIAKEAHPDLGGSDALFKKLNEAYLEAMTYAKGTS